MSMDFVCQKDGDLLTDPCQQEVRMKCPFIPGLSSSSTKVILEVVDSSFYNGPDLIGFIPFFRTAQDSGIGPEVHLWINISHTAAGGTGAWIFAMALAAVFPIWLADP